MFIFKSIKDAKACFGWGVLLIFILVFFDQISKISAKNIFYNSAFAFSLPLPFWLMYSLYAVILAGMIFYLLRHWQNLNDLGRLAWLLIFVGALCNIIERLILGAVRDFIYITLKNQVGIYNLADFYIILGILILLLANTKKVYDSQNF